jgi:hypothetical protein
MTEVTVHFFNTSPDAACLEYSYIPSGQRRSIELPAGTHAVSRMDSLNSSETYSLVQVYTVQTKGAGASWDDFPPPPAPKSNLATIIFQIRHDDGEVVATVYYWDGTSYSGTAPLQPTDIPCPSEQPPGP